MTKDAGVIMFITMDQVFYSQDNKVSKTFLNPSMYNIIWAEDLKVEARLIPPV